MLLYFRDAFLACLGCFLGLFRTLWESLGPLLGASWASLGDLGVSLGPSWPCWALLNCFFGLSRDPSGLSWAALEPPFSTLLAQEAARQRQGATRQPQKSPKRPPREPKRTPKVTCSSPFQGPFLEPLRDSFSEGFLDAWPLKINDFAGDLLQKRCFPPVAPKNKKR